MAGEQALLQGVQSGAFLRLDLKAFHRDRLDGDGTAGLLPWGVTAVILALPADTPVTRPSSTVATAGLPLFQVKVALAPSGVV